MNTRAALGRCEQTARAFGQAAIGERLSSNAAELSSGTERDEDDSGQLLAICWEKLGRGGTKQKRMKPLNEVQRV
jgi:hypothetical protein